MKPFQEKLWIHSLLGGLIAAVVGVAVSIRFFDDAQNEIFFSDIGGLCISGVAQLLAPFFTLPQCVKATVTIEFTAVYAGIFFSLVAVFALFRRLTNQRDDLSPANEEFLKSSRISSYFSRIVVTLAIATMVAAGGVLLFDLITALTRGLLNYPFGIAMTITTIYLGIVGFLVTRQVLAFRTSDLGALTTQIFIFGMLITILHSADPGWWHESVSSLGRNLGSGSIFDIWLALVAALVATYFYEVYQLLEIVVTHDKSGRWSSHILSYIGWGGIIISLGFVLVAAQNSGPIHNIGAFAGGFTFLLAMFVAVGLAILWPGRFGRFRLVPDDCSKNFAWFSAILGGIVIVAGASYAEREWFGSNTLVNFAGFEIISFLIMAFWMVYFNIFLMHYIDRESLTP